MSKPSGGDWLHIVEIHLVQVKFNVNGVLFL